jgi:heat shock protein HslJ
MANTLSGLAGKWTIVELNGKPFADGKAWMSFDVPGKRISANAGCNTMSGSVSLDGKSALLKVSELISTKMFCVNMENETTLARTLEKIESFSVGETSDTFTFYGANKQKLFVIGKYTPIGIIK